MPAHAQGPRFVGAPAGPGEHAAPRPRAILRSPTLPLVLLLAGFAAFPARAREAAESPAVRNVRVWFGGLEGAILEDPVALQVTGGGRVLFTTAPRPARAARWRHSVRVFTTRGQPLVFHVVQDVADVAVPVATSRDGRRRSRAPDLPAIRRQDQVLAQGFDDLVGDFDLPEARQLLSDEPAVPRRVPDAEPPVARTRPARRALCRAELAWPPPDGEHRLACGTMHLVVRTRRLPDGSR